MKKKKIILLVILIIILSGCKIQSQNPGELELVKEDFELDLKDSFDTNDVKDFGANVYSFKGANDNKLRLKLRCFDKGGEDEIFDIALPKIGEGEKLGIAMTSKSLSLYEISDKKISLILGADFKETIFTNKRTNAYSWTDGGVVIKGEPLSIFESYSTYSKDLIVSSQWKEDIKSGLKKDLSALVLELSISDDEK